MTEPSENDLAMPVLDAINAAEEIADFADEAAGAQKPRLLVQDTDPDLSVAALRDILAQDSEFFNRGVPVRLVHDPMHGGHQAHVVAPDGLVMKAHSVARPYKRKVTREGVVEVDARLPRNLAVMYLDWRGEWQLPVLNGVSSAPLLREDATIFAQDGYDAATGMFLEHMPDLTGHVPEWPTLADAAAALMTLRDTFRTFCFSDAEFTEKEFSSTPLVDITKPLGRDESAFLHALITAVARPSLHLAPGILIRAAPISGAGTGKGLLARCICSIAFGRQPHAVTGGAAAEEIEKRIAAELMGGSSTLFLDNLNNTNFKSDLLASAITERPARVRLLGKSEMVGLNASAFVVLTGNGLSVSEDLARRFVVIELDARSENPEARSFNVDILAEVTGRRKELLAAALTIWRWGRQSDDLKRGLPLGSFEQWCRWVRDPLLTLGCMDPAERVGEAKERDGRRQQISELFSTWWNRHGDRPVTASQLEDNVKLIADPQGRGRQFLASFLEKLDGIRMAGFVFTRQRPSGTWGAATYALERTDDHGQHRDHRGHRDQTRSPPLDPETAGPAEAAVYTPMPPMPPMPVRPAAQTDEDMTPHHEEAPAPDDEDRRAVGWSKRI